MEISDVKILWNAPSPLLIIISSSFSFPGFAQQKDKDLKMNCGLVRGTTQFCHSLCLFSLNAVILSEVNKGKALLYFISIYLHNSAYTTTLWVSYDL